MINLLTKTQQFVLNSAHNQSQLWSYVHFKILQAQQTSKKDLTYLNINKIAKICAQQKINDFDFESSYCAL